jgi:hypothetical protein
LKQLSLAVHNYSSTYGTLPPAFVADKDGRPAHSWRVLLLPFLERSDLYDQYNFAEPWNGPNNRQLADKIGSTFRRPEEKDGSVLTRFVAVVGDETAFPGARSIRFEDVTDGTARTILFVEVADSDIHWMEPRDLSFNQIPMRINARGPKVPRIGSTYPDVRAAFVDGMVHRLKDSTPAQTLRALLTAHGGEVINKGDY